MSTPGRTWSWRQPLGATHVVFHGGFHFSSDVEARFEASIARLKLAVQLAEARGIELHFENHNAEPEHAEIRYIPHTVAEMQRFLGAVSSPKLRWACNVGHAMLVPDGFDGFLEAFGADLIGHVRLHDTNGLWEEHFRPGEGGGIVDFRHVFTTLHQRRLPRAVQHRLRAAGREGPLARRLGRAAHRDRGRQHSRLSAM